MQVFYKGLSSSVLENYAKWHTTLQLAMALSADTTIRETLIEFKQEVMGKPSMEVRQECVSFLESSLVFLLARVYAEHIFPSGYKVRGTREGRG